MKPSHIATFAFTICLSTSTVASSVDQAISLENEAIHRAILSQKKIDASDDRAQQLRQDIEQLNAEIRDLELYQGHLQSLIASQTKEEESFKQQLTDIEQTRQGIVPLMYHMIDGLKRLTEQGLPIKRSQRDKRVSELERLMSRADVSDAEKFRLILDAYLIEVDYGTKLGSYKERVVINGQEREVDALHLGRVSLVARSIDGKEYWQWDLIGERWIGVEPKDYTDLRLAFDVANKTVAPELLRLPIQLKQLEGQQ
tara:strand:- start:1599 stop:2366 length:768 start_codon:yes stop_codon:yes gene_type:complete